MKLGCKFGVFTLGIMFVLVSAFVANAGMDGGVDRQMTQGANGAVFHENQNVDITPVVTWSEPSGITLPCGESRHIGRYHANYADQVGDDRRRPQNSSAGSAGREADFQSFHWAPETYGLMGDYSRDSR